MTCIVASFSAERFWGAAGMAAGATPDALAREFPAGYDTSKELARSDWTPAFLDEHQNETLIALSDLIIPKTDTPGAKEALVNRFIDQVLAAESAQDQRDVSRQPGLRGW